MEKTQDAGLSLGELIKLGDVAIFNLGPECIIINFLPKQGGPPRVGIIPLSAIISITPTWEKK